MYDDWLEAPYQRMYARADLIDAFAEQYIGMPVTVEGQKGEVTDVEVEQDYEGEWGVTSFEVEFADGTIDKHVKRNQIDEDIR